MILVKRFYDAKLAQASYLVASTGTGHAIVIDPNRDIEQYLLAAADEGVAISHVTETHIHADFVSGSRELAARAQAQLLLSNEGGPDWRYAFAADAGAVLLEDGNRFDVGSVRFEAKHTPGHTPEHLMFLVTDTSADDQPLAAVTGDFLFVGDVGRPDLLERAAHVAGSMDGAARALFHSLRVLEPLPDHLQIWPGHGAGSACGKGLGALPQSTLGYERRTNWALKITSESDFVRQVLEGQPEPPAYFAAMKRINRDGPPARAAQAAPDCLDVDRLAAVLDAGTLVIDTRPAAAFAKAHIPATMNIPLNRSFTTWAGALVPYTAPFYLIVDQHGPNAHGLQEVLRDLSMIGLEQVAGYADTAVVREWGASGRPTENVPRVDAGRAASMAREHAAIVLDVRSRAEWSGGHVPGATHIPLAELPRRIEQLSGERPIIVHCQGGARSAIAASLLLARGAAPVHDLAGGFNEWQAAGLPSER